MSDGIILIGLLTSHKDLERFQIRAVFHKPSDIDLSSYEISNLPAAITEWCDHEHVHKGRSISPAIPSLSSDTLVKALRLTNLGRPRSVPYPL